VFTSQYDNKRSGFNGFETQLTPGPTGTVVGMGTTAKTLFEVDDNYTYSQQLPNGYFSNPIYAQPLYIPGITVGGNKYNMLVVVTLNDTVFAWDTAGSPPSHLLWSRQGVPSTDSRGPQDPQGSAGNALWRDDCLQGGNPTITNSQDGSLPFYGILSTPVIDLGVAGSGSTPVMFLTSHCQTSAGVRHVYIHEIDLTTGMDVVAGGQVQKRDISNDLPSSFTAAAQKQRAALLEVDYSGATTPNLIYVPFGTGTVEDDALDHPYHGWLAAYTVNSSYVLSPATVGGQNFAFNSTSTACPNGNNGGTKGQQCTNNGDTPACDCYLSSPYQNVPNWGGQGGGCHMFGRGMAATAVGSDGWVHSFLACSNGGFQYTSLTGTPTNSGESVLDFRLTSTGFDTAPFQSFTPNGSDSSVIVKPKRPGNVCNCNSSGGSCGACTTTLQTLNVYDWDQGSCGILLFDDLGGNHRLLTCDKAGYGYLLTQRNLCGNGSDSQCVGWSSTDQGSWPFGMSMNLCDTLSNPVASNCDRVTSMAFYNTLPGSSSGSSYLYFWPTSEKLTAYQLSDNTTLVSGHSQQISWNSSSPTIIQMSGCTVGQNCPSSYFVPGDTIVPTGSGCTCSGSNCPVVTGIADDTTTGICGTVGPPCATINRAFPAGCTSPQTFQYKGYFLNPSRDNRPAPDITGYPGSAVLVTAQWDTSLPTPQYDNGVVWGLDPKDTANVLTRAGGVLRAYTAIPDSNNELVLLWSNSDTFCLSSFALPTVANGRIYVPTYAVLSVAQAPVRPLAMALPTSRASRCTTNKP
jgi:hypothetical protein